MGTKVTLEYIIPRYKCEQCGKGFSLPTECRVKDYVYKLTKKGKGGDHYYMLCSWGCFRKFKIAKAQERMANRKKGLAGYSIEETEKWLIWAKADVPEVTDGGNKQTLKDTVKEKYYHILKLYKDGRSWSCIRSKLGMQQWKWESIRQEFYIRRAAKERGAK